MSCRKKRKEKKETKHDRKERKEKREASVEVEALVKTAISYDRHVCCLITAMFPDVPLRFIFFANRGRFGYEAGESVTKMYFVIVSIARYYYPIDNVTIAANIC